MITPIKLKNSYLLFLLLWAAVILILAYAWAPGGLDVDSCNYAVVAKEVLRTNNWLKLYDPVYQGVFYYHFPLCIWITAIFFKLFGITTFSAKLFAMLSGVSLAAVIFYFGRFLKNQWVGFFAGLSFLLTNHIVRLSRQCRMDIPVSLFIALAIFYFILAQKRSKINYLFFGLFTCLAIFSKDVTGLAPLGIVFIYFALRLEWREAFHPLFILGLLIAAGLVLFWIWLDQNTLFKGWLNWNFLHLLKSPYFTVPWYYYIEAIAKKYFYFLPFAVYGGYLAIKEACRDKNYELYLLIIWAVFFPLAFSFGRQKLHYFILPMYPAAALLTGFALDRIIKEPIKQKIPSIIKYVLIIASIILLCLPMNIRSKRFAETVRLAPFIDQVLKEAPGYEFILYNQDSSAILFYSRELTRVKSLNDAASLKDALSSSSAKPRFFYLNEEDFLALEPGIRNNYQIALKYKNKIIISNQKVQAPALTLPDNS